MYFYKELRHDGTLACLLTYDNFRPNISDPLVVEITEEEYSNLLAEIEAANAPDPDEISAEEALDIILGGAT